MIESARSSWISGSSDVTVTDHTIPFGPSTSVSVPSATSPSAPTWNRIRTVGFVASSTTSTPSPGRPAAAASDRA